MFAMKKKPLLRGPHGRKREEGKKRFPGPGGQNHPIHQFSIPQRGGGAQGKNTKGRPTERPRKKGSPMVKRGPAEAEERDLWWILVFS